MRCCSPTGGWRFPSAGALAPGRRIRRDLLNELGADLLGNAPSPRTGQEHASVVAANAGVLLHPLEELQCLFPLLGLVPLVVLPEDFIGGRIDNHGLYGGRTNIDSNHELVLLIVTVRLMFVHSVLSGIQTGN